MMDELHLNEALCENRSLIQIVSKSLTFGILFILDLLARPDDAVAPSVWTRVLNCNYARALIKAQVESN